MGSSSTGILAYGYDMGEDAEGWHESAENALMAAAGFTETDWKVDGYFERRDEARKRMGITFQRYGCDGHNGIIMAAFAHRAYDYGTSEVDLSLLPANADEQLAWAVDVLGLEGYETPGWLVASFYG